MARARSLPLAAPLAGSSVHPAPGTSFHPLDDAGVLFSRATQTLYALSPSAAFLWCCFEDGSSPRQAAWRYAAASGRSPGEARADVAALLGTLRAIGVLGSGPAAVPRADTDSRAPAPDAGSPRVAATDLPVRQRYRLLGSVFELGFADAALCRAVEPALRHLATAARPDATGEVTAAASGFRIRIAGAAPERCATLAALAPMVKGTLSAAAINRRDFALYLHAAMLRRGGAALLLPAAPGSGKTCLSAALARAGFAYHSDEITLLDRGTLHARGAPVALTVKDGGWPVLQPLYPQLAELPVYLRVDGKVIRYLPPPVDPGDPALERAHPVRWVVFPRYAPAGPNRIEPVARVEGLRRLLDECLALRLRLDAEEVQALVAWIAGVECRALTFNDLDAAVRLVEGVCAAPEVAGHRVAAWRQSGRQTPEQPRSDHLAGRPRRRARSGSRRSPTASATSRGSKRGCGRRVRSGPGNRSVRGRSPGVLLGLGGGAPQPPYSL